MLEGSFACAYLDLLGFKTFLDRDLGAASILLTDIHKIIQKEVTLSKIAQIASDDETLRVRAERGSLNSFDYFLPFSDSIFIQSSKPDLFVRQLSYFLLKTFLSNAHVFTAPESQDDPTKTTIKTGEVSIGHTGNLILRKGNKPGNRFPALFRGGIDYGDSCAIEVNSIKKGKLIGATNLIGQSVVKAIKLEEGIKGPRLICTQTFYDALSNKFVRYIVEEEKSKKTQKETLHEIYWPAFNFNETNDCEAELTNGFEELFMPAVNLWKAFNHLECSLHYYNFLKLIIRSALHFFSFKEDDLNQAKKHISLRLKREGLENKTVDLMG